jgi:hypothetical protein
MSDLFNVPHETSTQQSVPVEFFAAIQEREEKHRHECEVRYVAALETHAHRAVYLDGVRSERGKEACLRLRADVWEAVRKAA